MIKKNQKSPKINKKSSKDIKNISLKNFLLNKYDGKLTELRKCYRGRNK